MVLYRIRGWTDIIRGSLSPAIVIAGSSVSSSDGREDGVARLSEDRGSDEGVQEV